MKKLLLSLVFLSLPGIASADDLASQSLGILRTHCYSCHGVNHRGGDPKYDVTNLQYLVNPSTTLIVPGHPEKSRIFERIVKGEMPPKPNSKLTAAEIKTLEKWIKDGAKVPSNKTPQKKVVQKAKQVDPPVLQVQAPSSKYVPDKDITATVNYDVARYGAYAINLRYLSLATSYNSGADETYLANLRAACSKLLNSLSFSPRIYVPQAVDKTGLVLRVDLNQIGWTATDWNRLLNIYPYNGAPLHIRADWFVANASRPPLYYDLLHLPGTIQEFERNLGVDRERFFLANVSKRAGITTSGVAFHNRVLEWNPSIFGPYWISYDFSSENEDKNVVRNPLGPQDRKNPFVDADFQHDANEVLAGLPNGLDMYYVANAAGKRLDAADPNLVSDPSLITRSSTIIPGLSCITCHSQGKQTKFQDVIRNGSALIGLEQLKVFALYPDHQTFTRLLERDRDRYVAATKQAIKPFLGENAVTASGVAEPIRPAVERYNHPLTLEQAALEVELSADQLRNLIASSGELQQLGLRPLLLGQTITRDTWETTEFGISPVQRILVSLGRK